MAAQSIPQVWTRIPAMASHEDARRTGIGFHFSVHAESLVSLDPFRRTRNNGDSEAIEPLDCIRPHLEGHFAIVVHCCFELLHETAVDPECRSCRF